jgi:hypothetical protein
MSAFLRDEKDIVWELFLETDSDKAGSCDSDKNIEDFAATSETQVHTWSRPQDTWNSDGVQSFTGGPCGLRIQDAPHVNNDSTPITIFLLCFMEVIQLLVVENKYYSQYLYMLGNDSRCSLLPEVTTRNVHLFDHINTNGT